LDLISRRFYDLIGVLAQIESDLCSTSPIFRVGVCSVMALKKDGLYYG